MKTTLLTRLRWRLEELRDAQDAKVIVAVLVLAALTVGGFLAARSVARASSATSSPITRVVTTRERVRVRLDGHVVTSWRLRKVAAVAHTTLLTQTIHSRNGVQVVSRPVTQYRIVYRKRLVTKDGPTRTVVQPMTRTSTATQVVTVTRDVTNSVTVTRPVTVVETRTVVSTVTDTLPITITVTLPLSP